MFNQSALIVYAKKKMTRGGHTHTHTDTRYRCTSAFRPFPLLLPLGQLLLDYARNSIQFECKYVFTNAGAVPVTRHPHTMPHTHSRSDRSSGLGSSRGNKLRACFLLTPCSFPALPRPQPCGFWLWPRL